MKTFKGNLPQFLLTTVLMASACAPLYAQTNTNSGAGTGSSTARPSAAAGDTAFIGKNVRDNMNEIQLSQLALNRGTSQMVKTAAQQMVTDHTQILQDLATLAKKNNMPDMAGAMMNGSGNMSGSGSTGTMGSGTSGSGSTGNNGLGSGNTGTSGSGTVGSGTTGSGSSGSGTTGSGSTGNRSGSVSNSGSGTVGSGTTGSGSSGMGTTGSGSTGNRSGSGSGNMGSGTSGSGSSGMGSTGSTSGSGTTSSGMGMQQDHMGMPGMDALRNATGESFDKLWVSQMLAMHEAKLTELTAAAGTVTDSDLKTAISQAIPKIRAHRDMLSKMNTLNSGNTNNRQ